MLPDSLPTLESVIHSSQTRVLPGVYFVYRSEKPLSVPGAFMVTTDEDETTIIAQPADLDGPVLQVHATPYRLIEIRVALPFAAVGFLAKVASSLAACGIPLLIVSTFSKDYVLVGDHDLPEAKAALADLGLPFSST